MSVTTALYTGVSGLINQGDAMNVIGNNISNVNTTGFKASRTLFSDLLSQNLGSNSQTGTGVQIQAVQNLFTQGTSQASSNVTDLTIQGDNFFALQSPTSPVTTQNTALLSRDGAFSVNSKLELVNPDGYQVLDTSGKPIVFTNTGTNPTTDFGKVTNISSNGVITYLATDGVTQNYYNASNGTAGPNSADTVNTAVGTASSATSAASAAITAASTADTAYTTAAAAATASPSDTSLASAAVTALNAANAANASAASAAQAALTAANAAAAAASTAAAAAPSNAALGAASTAATAAAASAQIMYNDAAAAAANTVGGVANNTASAATAVTDANTSTTSASLAAAASANTASRTVTAANEETVQRIALVHVADPTALTKSGGSLYTSNADSGVATGAFSLASNSANGTSESILSNSLEASNVDMSTEFVNMITTQRAYSANSKTITTADQMTQDVLGLIR